MIDKDKTIEYLLINEKARYEAIKAVSTCVKHILITIIICLTLITCAYMYFVVPVEEEVYTAENGSQIIDTSSIGGNNGM